MSMNQRRDQGKQNQNQKRPFDQGHQSGRINPNQRPNEGGFNREAAGQNDWQRQRPGQGQGQGQRQSHQGGRQQPGQGQRSGNLGNNGDRSDRR